MSGIDALNRLDEKQLPQPKIAVTADIFQEKELTKLFDYVITKPYNKNQLIDCLNTVLS
jgi:CheY-like chemotaxis protein